MTTDWHGLGRTGAVSCGGVADPSLLIALGCPAGTRGR
eukprot:SAG22_NODE_6729_length_818_cov_2.083449_2_plen_37_part_01